MPLFKDEDDIDHQANILTTWLLEVNERATVMKSRIVSDPPLHNTWYTNDLRVLKQNVVKSVGDERKRLRNKYVSALRKAKRSFLSQQVNENLHKGTYPLELLRVSMHGIFVFASKQQGRLLHAWCNFPCCLPGGTNVPCMEVPCKSSRNTGKLLPKTGKFQ